MQRKRNMIAAVLLLCAVGALGSDGVEPQACVPSPEVACFLPADYLNESGPVRMDLSMGMKLVIFLKGLPGHPPCRWNGTTDHQEMTINGGYTVVKSALSEKDSGEYTLTCETNNSSQINVHLNVLKCPTTPRLMLERVNERFRSPRFQCTSEGSPRPVIQWSRNKAGEDVSEINGIAKSSISSADYPDNEVMCCATNTAGQECSQLYDYDFDSSKDEVSNVTLSPGQTLLLRCQRRGLSGYPVWEKGDERLEDTTVGCDLKKKMCIKNDRHAGRVFAYLLMTSLSVDDSGTYTCRSPEGPTKSVYIHVQAEGFLSVQLDETKIVSAENASSAGLQASVSYHPLLTHCSWEAPDKTITKCTRDTWVTKHRNVMLRRPLESGAYKLHLQAGGYSATKTISVCVADEPVFTFTVRGDDVIVQTASLVPASYSWKEDITDNGGNSSYETIHSETDNDVLCNKKINTIVSKEKVIGRHVKFCLENSVNSWCKDYYFPPPPKPSTSNDPQSDPARMLLKILSLSLLLALVVISVALMYFVKKKKPQYQPQLQMIQMVGPNDNDYIYINFKDFEYDRKWEFPRENLELGKELGSGAFGMVVQATAYGINKPGVSQQVAVKMLKEKHHSVEKEALMSELKMLTHIGHHNNIVNLLGACTDSGPIYMIFQYCCYGDLLNYLKNNSERHHKSVTDAFNKDRVISLYHNLNLGKNQSELEARMDTYVPMLSSTSRGQEDIALLTFNSTDMDAYEDPSMIYESADDEGEDLQALTFDDLLSFAFQVAKGMEFLSSKHCIHRDLAARNVLVTKGRMVKIGDFGLAWDIDNDSNYVVRGNVRLPVKWMAPESIFQGLYTMKSDVWAYGILLWEIFSLGVTPYPGMKVDHTFYSMIERGFMMDCPYYADESVYGIMCKCWALDPCNRPSFSKLVSFMCDQLTNREEMLYYNMLDQYSTEYQNALAILDIAALIKHDDDKTQLGNDYCKTNATEVSKAEESGSVTVAAEEEEREEEEREEEEREEEEKKEEKKEEEDLKPFDTE